MTNKELEFILKMRDEATKKWNEFKGNVEGGLGRIKSTLAPFQGLIASAFSVYAVKNFIQASNEAERSQARLQQALRNAGISGNATRDEMLRYSEVLQKVTIYDDDVITDVQTMLTAMTNLSGRAVQPLTKTVLDLASGLNMDAESAAQLVAKSIEGQDALGRYGISLKDVHSKSEAVSVIISEVAKKFGGFAENEATTTAGKIKQLQVELGNLQEKIGDLLKSVAPAVLPVLKVLIQGFDMALKGIAVMVAASAKTMFSIVSFIAPVIDAVIGVNIKALAEYAKKMADAELDRRINDITEASKKASKGLDGLGKKIGDISASSNSLAGLREQVEKANKAVNDAVIGSKDWFDKTEKLIVAQNKLADAEQRLKNIMSPPALAALDKIVDVLPAKIEKVGTALLLLPSLKPVTMPAIAQEEAIEKFQSDYKTKVLPYLNQVQKGFYLIGMAADNAATREINAVNRARNAYLKASNQKREAELERIDQALQNENLTEEQRAVLRDQRAAVEKKYASEQAAMEEKFNQQKLEAEKKAFRAHKASAIVQSIVDTASAVVEALPNIPLSIIVGSLGAIQTGLIASQPEPEFHQGTGGPVYFDAPPSKEFPLRVRGGETFEVKTEAQQAAASGSFMLVINMNGPVSTPEAFKKIVQDGMRQMGITDVNQYFKNNRAKVTLQ
ncbi:MAG: hypothetical protein EPO24_09395 [Bacteroidetes bacterium]|nr:MAG: hypothetical protein EPO24_09395 [Bacteroidota bacterium]